MKKLTDVAVAILLVRRTPIRIHRATVTSKRLGSPTPLTS